MRRLRSDDSGISLVETMVAIVLMSVLGAVVLSGTIAVHKSLRVSDNETNGQTDVALAFDQHSRDIRNARGVVCDAAAGDTTCATHLQLWIDANSNYKQEGDETVTWKLRQSADAFHYDLVRTTETGATKVAASTIVRNVAFTYDRAPGSTQPAPGAQTTKVVTVKMYYYSGGSEDPTKTRTVTFATLLRNVP
jgi:type II secretory pathway pseudopilin PulG